MSDVYSYGGMTPAASDRTRTLFGQTMGFVALTAGVFALGAYLGRNLSLAPACCSSSPRSCASSRCASRPEAPRP